jgi:Tfp pilus assembly protein FimT
MMYVKVKGFTLIEMLFYCAICCSILFWGISSWVQLKRQNERETIVDAIKTAVHYARIQALSRGRSLVLSPRTSEKDWAQGMVLSELNKEQKKQKVLQEWAWNHRQWTIAWTGATGSNNILIADNISAAMSNGTFLVKTKDGRQQVKLILNRFGRVSVDATS